MERKIVSGIMLMLLVSMLALTFNIQPVKATGTSLQVIPKRSFAAVGETFDINVTIVDVTNLYAFEFKLGFDNTTLKITKVVTPPFLNPPIWVTINETGEFYGRYCYWLAIVSVYPAPPKSGTGTLATITFEVTGLGSCVLDLYDTKLSDPYAEPIEHYVEDGYFSSGPPVAIFTYSPDPPIVNETVTFNATASYDPDGYIVSYDWNFGDGTTGTGMIVNHTYTLAGIHNVTLTVTGNDALIGTSTKPIKVSDYPVARFTYLPDRPFVNEWVIFDASLSTPDYPYLDYTWDFGDGSPPQTVEYHFVGHSYNASGTFNVTLTITIIAEHPNHTIGLTDSTWKLIRIFPAGVRIYTDKGDYSAGDKMHVGLDVINLLDRPITVCIAIWLERPVGPIVLILHAHAVTLPAGFTYSNPNFRSLVLPSIPPGTYTWHAAFLHPTTHTIMIEDTAEWQFV